MPCPDTVTVFWCPKCGYWRGERDGLFASAGRCPRCVDGIVAKKPGSSARFRSTRDIAMAPMLEAAQFGLLNDRTFLVYRCERGHVFGDPGGVGAGRPRPCGPCLDARPGEHTPADLTALPLVTPIRVRPVAFQRDAVLRDEYPDDREPDWVTEP